MSEYEDWDGTSPALKLNRFCKNPKYEDPFVVKWPIQPSVSKDYTPYERPESDKYPFVSEHENRWLQTAHPFFAERWEEGVATHKRLQLGLSGPTGERILQHSRKNLYRRHVGLKGRNSREQLNLKELGEIPREVSDRMVQNLQGDAWMGEDYLQQLEAPIAKQIEDSMMLIIKQVILEGKKHLFQESAAKKRSLQDTVHVMAQNYAKLVVLKRDLLMAEINQRESEMNNRLIQTLQQEIEGDQG